MKVEPIKSMDFCNIVSAKKLKGSGLELGDVVLVTGTKQVPASKKDPYLTRTLVVVVKVMYNLPQIPGKDNDYKAYVVDPRSLERVSDEHRKIFEQALRQHHGE